MAKGQAVDSLYLTLGLDLSQLELDYIRADQTVTQNMNRLQKEIRNANLKIDVVMGDMNLSQAEKAAQVNRELNEIIARQRQEVEVATRAWQAEAKAAGDSAASTLNLQRDMLTRQRELNATLARQKEIMAQNATPAQGNLFSEMFNQLNAMSPIMSTFVNSLSAAAKQAVAAQKAVEDMKKAAASKAAIDSLKEESSLMSQLTGKAGELANLFKALPAPLKAAAVAMGALTATISLDKIAKGAVEGKAAVKDLAVVLGTSTAEAGKFKKVLGLMGVDADSASTALNRFRSGLLSAGEDGNETTRMLDSLGVSYKNLDGTIKTSDQLFFEIARHMKEFNELGISQDVILQTLGLRGAQYASALSKVAQYQEVASRTKAISFIDPEEADRLRPLFAEMEFQLKQIGGVLKQTLVPFAKATLPVLNDLLEKTTALIAAFKPEITAVMYAVGFAVDGVLGALDALVTILLKAKEVFNDFMSIALTGLNTLKNFPSVLEDLAQGMNGNDILAKYAVNYQKLFDVITYEGEKATMSEEEREAKRAAFYNRSSEDITKAKQKEQDALKALEESHKAAVKNMQEAEATYYHATHSEVENRIYDINAEMEAALKNAKTTEEAYSIREKAAAKMYAIEAEGHKAALANYREAEKVYFHMANGSNANKLFDIQTEMDEQLKMARTAEESESIVAKAAARMSEAWKEATDTIKEANESLDEEIFKLTHNDMDNKRFDLMKKAQKYLEQGADENKVMQFLNLSDRKIYDDESKQHKSRTYNPYRGGYMADMGEMFKTAMGKAWDKRKGLIPNIQMPSLDSFQGAVTDLKNTLSGNSGFSGAVQQFQGAVQSMAAARNQPQTIQLNVDVSGLGDVSNVVAQEAAKKILERLPSGTQVNLAY